ncbi:efflux RND transporter periplasmic adaptor subunit [Pseudomonas nitroreducens]|uniref:Efflux RND transporter periplasmic adaptor subunit n=1 Tax=Pseudomonas nitroreducens TaxID=46680 RepID=A0ABS0KUC8_PSENT|nr:efflux RND transporter periplasmic adaptor subunit [Pseudomonas nitroreducens]MBG6291703.1 efflux RND transporter periplasmic adaptor subunit [Pseudomonas nitroreducens]
MINKTPLAAAVLLASALGVSAYAWMGSEQAGGNHLDDATHADGEHHNSLAPTLHAEAASHADGEHHAAQEAETEEQVLHLTPAQIEAAGIQLVTAGPQALDEAFSLPGEIGFDQDRTAHVVPRTPGVVESVAVELGQNVKKGELLAVIASQQVSELRSELAAAQRRASLANKTFERERELWQEKISAEQDYLQARQDLEEARIALANAQQKTNALSGVSASAGGNRYELRAPFDGVVVEKHLVPGEVVSETTAAFTLSDLSRVWASFSVAPQDLARVQVGKPARVEAADLGMQVDGRVSYVGNLLGEQTRSAVARVTLANPDGAWRPGLFVNVRVSSSARQVPVAVPEQAVQEVEGQPSVFVRNAEGFDPRPVNLGLRSAGQVEVLAGLSAGDQVAAEGSFILKSELGKSSASHAH